VNVESVTVVVSAFMLGLGLGSLSGGWLSRTSVPLLPLLAAIELLTAVYGVLSLRIFARVGALVLDASLATTAAVSLALVLVPTLLMGATLPVLVGHLVRRSASVGSAVGLLYHVNTLGAGAACVVSAAVLFPFVGMRGSVLAAAGVNLLVAAGALAVHLGGGAAPAARAPAEARAGDGGEVVLRPGAALALAFLGGLVSLSYEIFFFRIVSYATGSSASAFALTLAAFLLGLAEGSRAAGRSARGEARAAARAALRALAVATAAGFAFLPLVGRLAVLGWSVLALALALVFLVARSFGVLLPTVAHLAVPADGDAGMGTARVYLANILGSAAGGVVTGFVLVEALESAGISAALAGAGVACACVLAAATAPSARARRLAALSGAGAAALAALASAPLAAGALERLMWKRAAPGKPPFAAVVENRSGIVAVDRDGAIYGHGMYDGRFNVDLVHDTNGIVRAYALSLFHPAPRDVLVIGLSSGSWAQVLAANPHVRTVTVVEINPGYVDLVARAPAVASLLSNPRVSIEIDDGRRWLRRNPGRRFDAIVSNTTYHFRAHASALLSAEFLRLLAGHLREGGIVLYNTTGSARVQRTGCLVFPHGARFSNQLVVSASPLDVDFARWRATLAAYRIDGRPVLDLARAEDRAVLDGLAAWESALSPASAGGASAAVERCPSILARTAGLAPVTDDNMGTEWRFVYGIE
jgi:predicted membrane-bound spermidine synthase